MSLSKTEAIELAREIKAEEPDLRIVRPIPVGEGKWLIVVKCGLWRWTVGSKDELEAGMRIIFGDPPETVGSESKTEGDTVSMSPIQMEA